MIVLGNDDRLVLLRLCPVIGIVRVFPCRVRESKAYCRFVVFEQITLDSRIERILRGMDTCRDFHRYAIGFEGRLDLSIPKQLLLTDGR